MQRSAGLLASKNQLSSIEAEYVSLSEAAKEAIYLKKFLEEILGYQEELTIFNNNQGADQEFD